MKEAKKQRAGICTGSLLNENELKIFKAKLFFVLFSFLL